MAGSELQEEMTYEKMTEKQHYTDPELDVVVLTDDIITTSTDPDEPIIIDPWDDWDD